jgi:ATP-dependent exoDNAse (exonuclease V) beta subunit
MYGFWWPHMNFNPQQADIIDSFGLGQAVIAGAGCGKTTTLVAKCRQLMRLNPKARFCAVSFTEKSVRDLRAALYEGLEADGLFETRHRHWIKTIHGLCGSIIREFPSEAGLQGGERILLEDEAKRLWVRSVDLLWSSNDSEEVGVAVVALLKIYSKSSLESLLAKLKNLLSFGVEEFIQKSFHRDEVKHLWICFQSVHRRYLHSKERAGALDFNDLEHFALKALNNTRVQKQCQQWFDLVLVDEFQDTNPIQGKILELFVKPSFSNLCMVGDPKQSIYRFRDADVTVFYDLSARMPKRHFLSENYRSHPMVIEFVNQVCAPLFEASDLQYEPLIAGKAASTSNFRRVVQVEMNSPADLVHYLKSENQNGIDYSEFVILARSLQGKTQVLLQSLATAQIPYVLGSGGRLYADPRIQELIAFLRALTSTEHRLSAVIALRSPWIQWSDEQIQLSKPNYFLSFLQSDHAIAKCVRPILQSAQYRPGQILEVLMRHWDSDSESNTQTSQEMRVPALSLWHICEELSAQGLRFEEVVQSLVDAVEVEKIEKDIPPPATSGAIRVMTIHASKGLQFPRVILLDFYGVHRSRGSGQDLIWDRKKGVHLFHRDDDGKKLKDDSENDSWKEQEARAAVAESKRLFYVAITRPQEQLIFAWTPIVKKEADGSVLPTLLKDDWRNWVETQARNLLHPVTSMKSDTGTTQMLGALAFPVSEIQNIQPKIDSNKINKNLSSLARGIRFRPRHSPSEWRVLLQCQLRYYKKWVQPDNHAKTEQPKLSHELKKQKNTDRFLEISAEKGEKIHKFLELNDYESLKEVFDVRDEDCVNKIKGWLTRDASWTIYPEIGFEVPLMNSVGNFDQALVGMMDRLEVNEDLQQVRIIDYKWTQKQKPAEDLISDYQFQLQLYTWAALRLISFAPKKIEAVLVHLTPSDAAWIPIPENCLAPTVLDHEINGAFQVAEHLNLAPATNDFLESSIPAQTGEYCRYCDHRPHCRAYNASSLLSGAFS